MLKEREHSQQDGPTDVGIIHLQSKPKRLGIPDSPSQTDARRMSVSSGCESRRLGSLDSFLTSGRPDGCRYHPTGDWVLQIASLQADGPTDVGFILACEFRRLGRLDCLFSSRRPDGCRCHLACGFKRMNSPDCFFTSGRPDGRRYRSVL